MADPSVDAAWCADWDALSNQLDRELSRADFDVDEISRLVRARQGLVSSEPPQRAGHAGARDEQRAWLLASLEREKRLSEKAEALRVAIGGYLASARAAGDVRKRFEADEHAGALFVNGEL